MTVRPIAEFDVTERPDSTVEARFTDTLATAPAGVTAAAFRDLEVRWITVRIARSSQGVSALAARDGGGLAARLGDRL